MASKFPWGRVINRHIVGIYDVIEYASNSNGRILFHVNVDGKDTHTSTTTLEEAFVFAFAYRTMDINEARSMSRACCKILNLKGDD